MLLGLYIQVKNVDLCVANCSSGVAIRNWGEIFDCWRITLFCLEKRLSKHKMTTCYKNLGRGMAPFAPLATSMNRSLAREII